MRLAATSHVTDAVARGDSRAVAVADLDERGGLLGVSSDDRERLAGWEWYREALRCAGFSRSPDGPSGSSIVPPHHSRSARCQPQLAQSSGVRAGSTEFARAG